jgi:hypothetical protein
MLINQLGFYITEWALRFDKLLCLIDEKFFIRYFFDHLKLVFDIVFVHFKEHIVSDSLENYYLVYLVYKALQFVDMMEN